MNRNQRVLLIFPNQAITLSSATNCNLYMYSV